MDGCLSTGQEANVYYAKPGQNSPDNKTTLETQVDTDQHQSRAPTAAPNSDQTIAEYAIKIYKASNMVFQDRDKYVLGEHRWCK